MSRADEVLEKTFYLNRIKSLETRAYMIQIAAMIGMGFFFSLLQGAEFKPFYFPMEFFIYVVLIMLIAMGFESFFFTILEMRNQDSDSGKYFTAKKASRNAVKIVVIALVFIVVFANPVSEKVIESSAAEVHEIQMKNSTATFDFSSVDRFGLMKNSVEVSAKAYPEDYKIFLFDKDVYYPGINYTVNARYSSKASSDDVAMVYPPETQTYYEYTLLIDGNGTGTFHVKVMKNIPDYFVIYVALFLSVIAIANAWWFVYLQKYIKRYGTELVSE